MMPLTMAKAGETVTIKKITGKDEVRLHLAELGFVVDSEVTVVNEIAGNLIVQVKESRLALDRTMAKAGETVTIKKITGKDEVRLHLAELGFVVDSEVTVVNEIAGNLIIQVKESRIALDKTMANRIMIG